MWVASGAAAESRASELCAQRGLQGRVMWFDAEANIWELSTRRGVADTVAKCKAANINTIIVDVKPLSGLVLYGSKIAPRLEYHKGKPYPADYDLLQTVIEEGRNAGVAVHAAINVFSEGSQRAASGPATKHTEWQVIQYDMDCTVSAPDGSSLKLASGHVPSSEDEVCLYVADPDGATTIPADAICVTLTNDGSPVDCGAGRSGLRAPEGGCVLVGIGRAGEWLRSVRVGDGRLQLGGTKVMVRSGASTTAHNAIFVNPLHPDARTYALSVIEEICRDYPIDGLVLDRMRYPNLYADFSKIARRAFEAELGRTVDRWPEDVYERGPVPGDIKQGPLFRSWLRFRAQVMRDFLYEARSKVKAARPEAMLGVYVGSWYPLYYDVGVNWGSRSYRANLDWWPEGYEETGYADLTDYIMTGCYYPHVTRQDAVADGVEEWRSVEAATDESVNAIRDAALVYGGLYLLQYEGDPDRFVRAVKQCLARTQGCMLFDLVYVRKYDWWDALKRAFPHPTQAPHAVPELLGQIRDRAAREEQSRPA